MTYTGARIWQWIGLIVVASLIGGGYYYFRAQAGIKTGVVSPTGSLTSGLVGYWTFDRAQLNGTTAYDRSASKYHGSLTNGPTLTDGMLAQAVDLDGSNDYVTMSDQPNLDFGDAADFSISGWFYRDTFTTDDTIVAKINGLLPGETGYVVYIDDATDQLIFRVGDGIDSYTVSSTPTYTTAQWVHFAVVWDQDSAANTKLYANGQAIASTSSGTIGNINDLTNALGFQLGNTFAGSDYFDGKLDDMRVYNRVLTAAEIQTLYEFRNADQINSSSSQPQGTGRLDSGLAGYWKLDDGSGTSATDSSTNGNAGTLTNGPTWTTGQIGGAVDFDGSDDNITTSKTMANLGTVSAWVNTTATINSSASYYALYATTSGNSFFLSFNGFGGENRWDFSYRGNFGTTVRIVGPTYTSNTQQGWHHLVATWDVNSGAVLYIDGQRASSTSTTTSAFNSMSFGMSTNSLARWVGKLDEVRMYSRVLSADEVTNLYRLASPTGVDTSLKGYWSFNGKDMSGTTAYDRSGAGNNGTLTNGPTATQGKLGQALDFDGSNDYVLVKNGAILSGSTNATISAWIKTSISAVSGGKAIYAERASSGNDIFKLAALESGVADNTATFILRDDAGTLNRKTGSVVINDNRWHHIVAVKNNTSLLLYVDGVADGSPGTQTGTNTYTNANLKSEIGQDASAQPGNFNGSIDEVRIYNRALSAAEIKAQYDAGQSDETNTGKSQPQGTGNLDSGLSGYWKLDDGSGTSATDSSTNGNTGTLTNGPTWTTGQIGGAVDFDGTDDYITAGSPSTLDDMTAYTATAWIAPDAVGASGVAKVITKSGTGFSSGWAVNVCSNEGTLCASVSNTLNFSVAFGTAGRWRTPADSISLGQWNFVAVSYNRSSLSNNPEIYINGVSQTVTETTSPASSYVSDASANLIIGNNSDGTHDFDGSIDEVRVYNRELSADEVSQLYRLTSPTDTDTSLKGYWSFNGKDISGTTAYDRSGAGNNGTLTNGPTATQGKLGQALSFDGTNDYVDVTNTNYSGEFTYSWWYKTSNNSQSSGMMLGGDNTGGFYVKYGLGSGKFFFRIIPGGTSDNTVTPPVENEWHHLTITRNSNDKIDLYIDGGAAIRLFSNTAQSGNTTIDYIGRSFDAQYFNGLLDEVRIYNTALTAAQVAALYNQGR